MFKLTISSKNFERSSMGIREDVKVFENIEAIEDSIFEAALKELATSDHNNGTMAYILTKVEEPQLDFSLPNEYVNMLYGTNNA